MFFNCGPLSGASVLHKHIQLIPFESIGELPIEQAYLTKESEEFIPFIGLKVAFKRMENLDPVKVHTEYLSLLKELGLD